MHIRYTLDGLPVDCWRMYAKDFFLTICTWCWTSKQAAVFQAQSKSGRACTPLADRLDLDVGVSCTVGPVLTFKSFFGPLTFTSPAFPSSLDFHWLFSAFSIFTQGFQYQAAGWNIYFCDESLRTKPASEWSSLTDRGRSKQWDFKTAMVCLFQP